MHRFASLGRMLATLASSLLLFPAATPCPAFAEDGVVLAPDGGRLDALDPDGNVVGPCPLRHTDVAVEISGPFARVTVTQLFANPFTDKIEAVYTFPLSDRAAVDRMRMTIGDRVVEGEVHERSVARATYEAARARGHVASLLEQERPNLFTQSVANIEPGVEVRIEISSVEILEPKDGQWSFTFPMVVGPRYVPGSPNATPAALPTGFSARRGAILLAPAKLTIGNAGDVATLGTLQLGKLHALLGAATPIRALNEHAAALWYAFEAAYPDGSKESGSLYVDGTGEIGGRWFFTDPKVIAAMGTGFSPDTDRVPDASRVTPEPVRPGTRAGHDISLHVTIDTGGPALTDLRSALHEIDEATQGDRSDGTPRKVSIELRKKNEIPNRDFVLTWKEAAASIEDALLAHTDSRGGFVTLMLQPPARIDARTVVPREVVFVLDTSGSMSGLPIEKAKAVIAKAIDGLRALDTFNLITFSGDTHVLWTEPRQATDRNRGEAQAFLASRTGGGGTEMMKAIETALAPTANRDAKAGTAPIRIVCFLTDGFVGNDLEIIDAVKRYAATTRVFSFGIGNSVNRFLLDGMARAGRGAVETVLLNDDADAKVARFVRRIETPVLTDVEVEFSPNLEVTDVVPARVPDLFDEQPIVVHGRFRGPRTGTVTVRGNTGAGPWSRVIPFELPAAEPAHDTIATCWARATVDAILGRDLAAVQRGDFSPELKKQVVALGETFGILTPFTSFVAVEKMTVTIGGAPRLVSVPVEMPDGVSYEAAFGEVGFGGGGAVLIGSTCAASAPAQQAGFASGRGATIERLGAAKTKHAVAESLDLGLVKGENDEEREPLLRAAAKVPADGDPSFLFRERAVVAIAHLADAGKNDEALKLAQSLVARDAEFPLGLALRDALADQTLGEETRKSRIASARDVATKAIDSGVRQRKLSLRLDARLLPLTAGVYDGPAPSGVTFVDGGVVVSVTVAQLDDATIDRLKKAGLVVQTTARTVNLVIGVVPIGKVADLALLDDVRRVEPTQMK
ncbi:MAG: VWA domain-containing protein [Planctomycetes bacterium]|nr:VWA domain-containing protein [Planctomycetota bacterium]